MTIQSDIERKLADSLSPRHLEVINESHMHAGPATESHFKLVIVSDRFAGQNRVRRHQTVNTVLADELAGPVHALSMQTHTADEWQARGGAVMASPACRGGSKAEA